MPLFERDCSVVDVIHSNTATIISAEFFLLTFLVDVVRLAAEGFDYCPGAKIVYDEPAPVFHPDDEKEHQMFVHQMADIKAALKGNYLQEKA
jgi:hypothetical protein